jgi:hypothetical protein
MVRHGEDGERGGGGGGTQEGDVWKSTVSLRPKLDEVSLMIFIKFGLGELSLGYAEGPR